MVKSVLQKWLYVFSKYSICLVLFIVFIIRSDCCYSIEFSGEEIQKNAVVSSGELSRNLQKIQPGSVIAIAPGIYSRGMHLKNVHGLPEAPIIIKGNDPENPPVFSGLGEGIKVSSCSYIKFENLVFRGFPRNGVNVDDSGNVNTPSHHIILENITVLNTGPEGNHDAIKFSGVVHFVVRNCRIEGWGGSGIDLVGCQNGLIEKCSFIGKDGFRTANGIQIKGGSRYILVQNSIFRNAGWRIISVGGATGLKYFRPAVMDFEAKWITVAGNTFVGGEAQIAWVTAQESHVHHNLFYLPGKWVGRVLQETKKSRFAPCGKGLFENNLVVVDDRVKVFFNVGKGTRPSSFVFRKNAWFNPQRKIKLTLPVSEDDGVYNVDPEIEDSGSGFLKVGSTAAQLQEVGPKAYVPWVLEKDFSDVVPPLFVLPESSSSSLKSKVLVVGAVVGGLGIFALVGVRLLRPKRRRRRG